MPNKMDFINLVADSTGLTKRESAQAIDALLTGVRDALLRGEKVYLPKVGTFHVVTRPKRTGRNPSTGETIQIPPRKAIRFKVSLPLKQALIKGGTRTRRKAKSTRKSTRSRKK